MTVKEWTVEVEAHLGEKEYSIVRDADQEGMPKLCLGVFKGNAQMQQFGDMLQRALDDGRAAEEARAEYEQIIQAIRRADEERRDARERIATMKETEEKNEESIRKWEERKERTRLPGRVSCCKDCTKRFPGCHNEAKCQAWAEEVERRKKEKAAREAARNEKRLPWERRKLV